MKIRLLIFTFAITSFLNLGISSEISKPDSISVTEELDFSNFSENLNSLMNLWFVQTSLANDTSLLVGDYENISKLQKKLKSLRSRSYIIRDYYITHSMFPGPAPNYAKIEYKLLEKNK